jgi:PDZ domain-containing secreted protein
MNSPTLSQQEKKSWIADTGRRRSMRVLLSVPVTIAGKLNNQDFSEDTRTLVVNAHGALISLVAGTAIGQTVTIANKATRHSHECRIVHVGPHQAGKSQIGVEFLKPSPAFWQIDFPPEDWVVPEN